MKKLLVIADSPTSATGFGNVTRNVLQHLTGFDIAIIGVNYYGDPHPLQSQYRIYNPAAGGDVYGFGRLTDTMQREQPDVVLLINDIWVLDKYVKAIRQFDQNIPIVLYTPIDSENIKTEFVAFINQDPNTYLITYTMFAAEQLQKAGYTKQIAIIPHGIETDLFAPMDKQEARKELFAGTPLAVKDDLFIVLNLNRNQVRKRIDTLLYVFAKWLERYPHENAYLHYHGAVHDLGIDVEQYAQYLGIDNRLILTAKNIDPGVGIPREKMRYLYAAADVFFSTSAVEGWHLPTHEAMACGLPCILGDYSALSEWPSESKTVESVMYVPVNRDHPVLNTNGLNTIHYMIDNNAAIEALEMLYQDEQKRKDLGKEALRVATQEKYQWSKIAKQFELILQRVIPHKVAMPTGDVLRVWKKEKSNG